MPLFYLLNLGGKVISNSTFNINRKQYQLVILRCKVELVNTKHLNADAHL